MKTARLLALAAAVAGLVSLPLMAQEVNASAQQGTSASAAGMQMNQSTDAGADAGVKQGQTNANGEATGSLAAQGRHGSANADANGWAAGDAQMRPVTGELEGKLDSKTAKVGEPVVLKTTEKMKTADGFVIPRGSRLVGHVTEVQARSKGHRQSSIGIAFDRAELKNGQSFAIHSVIESVGPGAAQLEADSMANQDAFAGPVGGGMAGGGGAMGGSAAVGRAGGGPTGGLLGGGAGVVGGATSTLGGASPNVASSAGGALNAGDNAIGATGNLAGNAAASVGRGVNGSAGAASSLGAHATSIPGLMLDSDASGGASGMFTATQRNVHFDSGTQMVLGVAAEK